ncbi:MAG: substrate-binding domain-containing protein [Lachnospiraceae bacterium]|nr:substrate-binding domain-containing protein [Lachnospiraceae bacterium]
MIKNTTVKRFLVSVLTFVVILVSLAGCSGSSGGSGSASGAGLKIFFTTPILDEFKELLMNAVSDSGKKAGAEVTLGEPCGSVDDQVAQIRQAASSGYDIIICNPVDSETVLQLEVAAGELPVIFINSQPEEDKLEADKYMYVGSNEEDAAFFQAEYVWNKLGKPKKMNVAIFSGQPGHPAAVKRTKGVKDYFKKNNVDVTYVFNDTAYWDTEKAYDAFQIFLKTGQAYDAVICNNDSMAVGVVRAMTELGIDTSKIPVVGVDATDGGCQSIRDGGMQFTVYQSAVGQGNAAIDASIALVKHGTASGVAGVTEDGLYVWVPYVPVDSKNVNSFK